jgi:KUP system potassium uptake protein
MERFLTGDLERGNRHVRSGLEKSRFAKGLLKTIGVLAVSMVMSDGVLTPAQSVLGAVQGLNVVKPDITNATVVGTTCGILILLFLIQPFGTEKIAVTFAPIVIIWLGFNAAFGMYNLAKYDHSVLKAFSPGFAFEFLIRNKTDGWRMLGGVLLAFTGVEALFADLGAFSRKAIQLSWLCYTYPCLLLAYIGQAAFISHTPGAYTNPFFNSAPPGTLYPALIIAILAAIVASQAIITATFQVFYKFRSFVNMLKHSLAPLPDHETFIFPSSQGCSHFETILWSTLRTAPQLAAHDWNCPSCGHL